MINPSVSISDIAYSVLYTIALIPHLQVAMRLLLFTSVISAALLPLYSHKIITARFYNVLFISLLCSTIFFFRLPYLTLTEQNPDESQEIAAAMTLLSDPVYWRSVAVETHGPLTTYPLLIPRFFGLRIDFGSAKLVGVLMLIISVICMLYFFRRVLSEKLAMLAVIPAVIFICLSDTDDFIAYNAEYPVSLVTALSLYLIGNLIASKEIKHDMHVYLTGLVIGCAPLVKMQSVPIAGALILFCSVIIYKKNKVTGELVNLYSKFSAGCLTATLLFGCLLWYHGLLNDFSVRFIQGQLNYISENIDILSKVKMFLASFFAADKDGGHFFSLLFLACIVMILIYFKSMENNYYGNSNNFAASTITAADNKYTSVVCCLIIIVFMTLCAIFVPGRGFEHYYLLLVFPLVFLTGSLFISISETLKSNFSKILCTSTFIVTTVLVPIACQSHILRADVNVNKLLPMTATDQMISGTIKEYTNPGEKMLVWGWAYSYYVYTDLIMACKTPPLQMVFGNQLYYRSLFYNELIISHPPVILDAVAPTQFIFKDKVEFGFDKYPPIAGYIYGNYSCVKNVDGNRIFISKQRLRDPGIIKK
jgi:hypothetical protein